VDSGALSVGGDRRRRRGAHASNDIVFFIPKHEVWNVTIGVRDELIRVLREGLDDSNAPPYSSGLYSLPHCASYSPASKYAKVPLRLAGEHCMVVLWSSSSTKSARRKRRYAIAGNHIVDTDDDAHISDLLPLKQSIRTPVDAVIALDALDAELDEGRWSHWKKL
jgi:hypothetical protein